MYKILDAIADCILIIDKNYKIAFANKAMLEHCELKKDKIIGQRCHEVSHRCHKPCLSGDMHDALCPHAEIFKSGRAVTTTIHRHIMPDGRELFFDITASPLKDKKGDVIQIIEVLRDVTELKKTDEMIKNILATVDEGFIIIDRDFRVISANGAFADEVKMPLEDILGKPCYMISHHLLEPCKESQHPCSVRHVFETGEPYTATHTHYDKQGIPVYVLTKAYPLSKNEEGKVLTAIEVITDISEKVKLEDQLRHAQKMESIGTLAGGIAHDFNNILSAIIGYGNLTLMKMAKDDPQRLNIEHMLEAADRAAHLTKSLLAFSRKQMIDRNPVDLNETILSMEKLLLRVIGEDIEFKTILPAGKLPVLADTNHLEQVLMNLATNARDAMPKGGAFTIATQEILLDEEFIKAYGYGRPGKYALITATDTGMGIDEETRQRIFEPFFTTKEVGKGTGLGLAVVYGIIKQHEGYINVYSKPGKGTTFRIYLPVIASDLKIEKKSVQPAYSERGSETILLAEDDASLRKLGRTVLEQFGYTVIAAVDGEDAIKKYSENKDRIQLLLFDLIMPGKSGKEAYDKIREISPDIKVIFTSGYSPDIIQQKAVFENGVPVLFKPVALRDLLEKVRRVLDEDKA